MFIVQSYVDLITNSSTSIYQFANNPDAIKDIFNAVLQSVDSSFTFDDLFTIETHYDVELEYAEDYYRSILDKYIENDLELQNLETLHNSLIRNCEWIEAEEQWELICNRLIEKYGAITLNRWAETSGHKYSSNYIIKTKSHNPKIDKAVNLINDLFNYDAVYEG